jgi:ribosomal protein L11 methyltransferase
MSWRVTLPATRAQGEAIGSADEFFPGHDDPPVVVADEPDEHRPDNWLIHAYFEQEPAADELAILCDLASGPPQVEQLADENWIVRSQQGLEPIRAGRFFVHTPSHPPELDAINFEIDAGLAFGTGQHATTKGCLQALDGLERGGKRFTNIADIGTGTGLLAFAALRLWPDARAIATDIDPIAVDVARDNALINQVPLGEGPGELLLTVADGLDSAELAARGPFDLLIANILAGPLIELAPAFTAALSPGATVVLAGLLDTQAEAVTQAYTRHGCRLVEGGTGEWRVLVLEGPVQPA